MGLFDTFDAGQLENGGSLPDGFVDSYGLPVAAQVVGIAYNPTRVDRPTGWADLFEDEFASRLGLTGFQTTFGTTSLIEIAKVLGLVISLMQIELPLMLLPLLAVMNRIDPRLLDASAALGASRLRTFLRVILPLALPGLAAGCLLVFASATAAFISQSVIGGGRLIYMPLVIWQQSMVIYDWPFAAVVSISLLVSVLAVLGLFGWLGRISRGRIDG